MVKIKKIEKIAKDYIEDSKDKRKRPKKSKDVNPNDLIPTGSTTFNLECSGRIEGAFKLGKMVNIIGDSHAGKTLFAFTIFAECSILEKFNKYRFIYDDVEAANAFNLEYLFGAKCSNRVEQNICSRTIEDFNDNVARALESDKPFIYVLDSFDALTSEAAMEKDTENRKSRERGRKTAGSYGDGKAKGASEMFTKRIQDLNNSKSVLIIISQTRDNIGFGAQFTPKTRSGGKALKFYAFHEIWLAMQKKVKAGKRTIVTNVQAKITKNKLTGRHGEAYFPVLFDYGVDNIMSCINFLRDEGGWTGSNKAVNTQGFLTELKPKKKKSEPDKYVHPKIPQIIRYIEDNNKEEELFKLCQDAYNVIMEKLRPKRKRKYTN